MVILVIGGYQWLSEVISDIENNFMHFKVMVIMVIDGYLWLPGFHPERNFGGRSGRGSFTHCDPSPN